ncbi:MAG: T9SS type A sorting domain-containing protein [Proteiniphilum sp.]|nr:T9SS type A sorting domain-containing protein [Proteiniphilum sp.]
MNASFRILLAVIMLAISSIAFAQSGYVYSEYFEDCAISSRSIFVCSDNSVVVLGNLDYNYGPCTQYLSITKLDPSGNLLWREWMGETGYFLTITGVDIDENDTVTFITTVLASDLYIRLWSIDSSGNFTLLSEEPYIQNYRLSGFNKALRTPNNEIVAVGKTRNIQEELSACFYRFSATGDTLATAYYPLDASSPYQERGAEAYDLALGDNGNILITCQLSIGTGSILEIDPMGNIVNRIDVPGYFLNNSSSLAVVNNPYSSGYLIVGPFGFFPDTAIKAYLLHNDELTYMYSVDHTVVKWPHSTLVHEDGVFICGTYSAVNASLVNLSVSGELNWTWQQEGENLSNIHIEGIGMASTALLAMDGEGCVYWAWGNGRTQLITKLLPNGQLPVVDEVQSPMVNEISAYPNPMKDEIKIKIKQENSIPIQGNSIEIFNIKGQLIRSLDLTKGETVWDGRDDNNRPLASGTYIVKAITDRNAATTKITIIK